MLVQTSALFLAPIDGGVEFLYLTNVLQQQIQTMGSTRCPKQIWDPLH
jgi:hypothetical protein